MSNLKEMRRDWMLKEEALDYTPWRTRFVKLQLICPKTDYVIFTQVYCYTLSFVKEATKNLDFILFYHYAWLGFDVII